ncbi:putative acetyltransferase [Timonella sp. A28]|uniref:putative acetyltransferase n=1 Tax=Timonella sp. A28 TaxID=3442640 RepID=UPI003EBDB15F
MNNPNAATPQNDPDDLWQAWEVGQRVMVRVNLPSGSTHKYTDILGTIIAKDSHTLTLETRAGITQVQGDDIAIGKLIPPPPQRRARRTPQTP